MKFNFFYIVVLQRLLLEFSIRNMCKMVNCCYASPAVPVLGRVQLEHVGRFGLKITNLNNKKGNIKLKHL